MSEHEQPVTEEPVAEEPVAEADEDVLVLEEVETELELPVWEPTGEPRVDAALDELATLDSEDVHQHAAVFEDIHQRLRATLTDLDAPA